MLCLGYLFFVLYFGIRSVKVCVHEFESPWYIQYIHSLFFCFFLFVKQTIVKNEPTEGPLLQCLQYTALVTTGTRILYKATLSDGQFYDNNVIMESATPVSTYAILLLLSYEMKTDQDGISYLYIDDLEILQRRDILIGNPVDLNTGRPLPKPQPEPQ